MIVNNSAVDHPMANPPSHTLIQPCPLDGESSVCSPTQTSLVDNLSSPNLTTPDSHSPKQSLPNHDAPDKSPKESYEPDLAYNNVSPQIGFSYVESVPVPAAEGDAEECYDNLEQELETDYQDSEPFNVHFDPHDPLGISETDSDYNDFEVVANTNTQDGPNLTNESDAQGRSDHSYEVESFGGNGYACTYTSISDVSNQGYVPDETEEVSLSKVKPDLSHFKNLDQDYCDDSSEYDPRDNSSSYDYCDDVLDATDVVYETQYEAEPTISTYGSIYSFPNDELAGVETQSNPLEDVSEVESLKQEWVCDSTESVEGHHQVKLSFTDKEMERLREASRKCGLSVKDYIECCALKVRLESITGNSDYELWRKLMGFLDRNEQFVKMFEFCSDRLRHNVFTSDVIMDYWYKDNVQTSRLVKMLHSLMWCLHSCGRESSSEHPAN